LAIFVFLLILLSLAYCALFILYYNGWRHLPTIEIHKQCSPKTTISIIIPARNEQALIKQCIESILKQHYDAFFEIIVINDHSTDNTLQILQSYGNALTIINLQDALPKEFLNKAFKKKAIELAIEKAKGELIITTDADTIRGKYWLHAFAECYATNKYKIIAGPVNYISEKSILKIFQIIDFITMQGITAASLYYHFNSTCNGANLAYSKKVFEEVEGFKDIDEIASGDDMLLLHKIEKKYPKSAYYLKCKEAIVDTYAMPTIGSFLQQRIRWASKAKHYTDKRVTAVLAVVFLFNICILIMTILACMGKFHLLGFATILCTKIGIEFLLVQPLCIFFNQQKLLFWHILLQPFHVLYIIVCGALGQIKQYDWKGRQVS
jgi:cellulose synthase/poly-beta-1,6-N-acetylglucosamine synthase-like glycosyltransferase